MHEKSFAANPLYRKTFAPKDLRSEARGGNQPHEEIL